MRIQNPWEPHYPTGNLYPLAGSSPRISPDLHKEDRGQAEDQGERPSGWRPRRGGEALWKRHKPHPDPPPHLLHQQKPNHCGQGRKPCHSKSSSWNLVLPRNGKRRKSFTPREGEERPWAHTYRQLLPPARGRVITKPHPWDSEAEHLPKTKAEPEQEDVLPLSSPNTHPAPG